MCACWKAFISAVVSQRLCGTSGMTLSCPIRISAADDLAYSLTSLTSFRSVTTMDYRQYITIDSGKRGGKPCIRGMRITVYDVLEYLASGMSEDDILADFPDLTREDIRASLAFAADRQRKLVSIPPA